VTPVARAAERRHVARRFGFTKRSVIRSQSPIAAYFSWF
jgi:hypothetical protein